MRWLKLASAALLTVTLLTACQPGSSEAVKVICPTIRQYDQKFLNRVLDEYRKLPPGSAIAELIGDYKTLREVIRVCREKSGLN